MPPARHPYRAYYCRRAAGARGHLFGRRVAAFGTAFCPIHRHARCNRQYPANGRHAQSAWHGRQKHHAGRPANKHRSAPPVFQTASRTAARLPNAARCPYRYSRKRCGRPNPANPHRPTAATPRQPPSIRTANAVPVFSIFGSKSRLNFYRIRFQTAYFLRKARFTISHQSFLPNTGRCSKTL